MLISPRFRPDLRVRVLPGDGVFLFGRDGCRVLIDPLCEQLVPLIDGKRTTEEIAEALNSDFSLERVYFGLHCLEAAGYLCESDPAVSESEAAFWASAGLVASDVLAHLATAAVRIRPVGAVSTEPLERALSAAGIQVDHQAELVVVYADDYLHPELADINLEAMHSGRPWVLFRPVGRELWLGPLFRPGEGACWECLAFRLRSVRFLEEYVRARTGENAPIGEQVGTIEPTAALAAQLVAVEIVKLFAADGRTRLLDTILTFDLLKSASRPNAVVRRPQCCCCGTTRLPDVLPPAPALTPHRKGFNSDGGHRVCPPEVTLERNAQHVSPITGIVDTIEPIDNLPNNTALGHFHVFTAGHNFAFQFKNLRAFSENMRSRSAGKGMTSSQARAGALAEALERYSAIFQGDEPRVRSSYRELGERAIHPNTSMLFSERQYAEREVASRMPSTYSERIPANFENDAMMDWSPVYSLSQQTWRYLPTVYLYFPSQVGPVPYNSSPFFYADSNGNASGNVLEEAVLQGFLELVERDAVAIWWYNRVRMPGVDLSTFAEPFFRETIQMYDELGRDVWVLDLTNDLMIPSFAAVSRLRCGQQEDIVFGFGCHLEARLGVSRALTEMNQMLALSFGENEERGIARGLDHDLNEWFQNATVNSEPYLLPAPDLRARTEADTQPVQNNDLLEDILLCRSRVERLGLEVLVLDQTRPDVGLSAVKVLVPGLRHFWPRFAPGRLYDVPVELGWLTRPLTEEELNPRRMFF